MEGHVELTYKSVNLYETCDHCNYGEHTCYFCGQYLDHVGRESDGTLHDVAYCRPDLVAHDPGPLCTWPDEPESNKYRDPGCYWDHEKNELRND